MPPLYKGICLNLCIKTESARRISWLANLGGTCLNLPMPKTESAQKAPPLPALVLPSACVRGIFLKLHMPKIEEHMLKSAYAQK
ncbi:MAG: hypothetical protein CL912_14080 [Deltaproteobacteria bacterium]|nr:hypothetical protein [Deltaproteobacteria bacterium]